ncbi:MAG: NAD(+)/NADH kinase [Clostridia bacterium]|nr:NAD(+)/NADH kinase [Clostridia bacterium]
MQFWIHPNPTSAEAGALAEALRERLGEQAAERPEDANIIAVLGGDGTLLRAVRMLNAVNKPYWLVNCGHLGYLSDCEKNDAFPALEKILQSEFQLEYRAQIGGMLENGRRISALNELLFHRGACVHTLQISVEVNGSLALRYRGDGLIVCTPSGSTAYNLSAGGPVLMPEMELLTLTPICAQSLSAVPIVVSSHDRITISWRMGSRENQDEWPDLTADGQEKLLLPLEGSLTIGELPPVVLVRTQDADFYGRLQYRMHWNAE